MPSGRFAANGAWLAVQVWRITSPAGRIGLGERTVTTKTLRRRVFALVGRITRRAASVHLPRRWPWEVPSSLAPWPGCEPFHSRPDGQPATDPTSPQTRATPVRERSLLRILSSIPRIAAPADGHRDPVRRLKTSADLIYPNGAQAISPVAPSPLFRLSSRRPSVSFGGFGLRDRPYTGPFLYCRRHIQHHGHPRSLRRYNQAM